MITIGVLMFLLGILLLYIGGEGTVNGAAQTAFIIGIKPLFIGLTIVAYGTSLPEFCVSLLASLKNLPDVTIGNVCGSTIVNIFLCLGIGAIIKPLNLEKHIFRREATIMILSVLILIILSYKLTLTRYAGAILIICFMAYIIFFISIIKKSRTVNNYGFNKKPFWKNILMLILGLIGIIIGAKLIIDSTVIIGKELNIPEGIIALSVIAIGTSLPELTISIIAAYKNQFDILIGNIIGSNIFNVLWIIGFCAIIKDLVISETIFINIIISLIPCIIITIMFYTNYKLSRAKGLALLITYAIYIFYLANIA